MSSSSKITRCGFLSPVTFSTTYKSLLKLYFDFSESDNSWTFGIPKIILSVCLFLIKIPPSFLVLAISLLRYKTETNSGNDQTVVSIFSF